MAASLWHVCCAVFVVTLLKSSFGTPLLLFVDGTSGSDANPGSIDKPFKTIVFARDYIRQLKNTSKFPVGGVVVNIRSGSYEFTSEPFSLTAVDSGESDSPIIYQAYNGESVVLLAGVELPTDHFTAVTDPYLLNLLQPQVKNEIVQIDLKKLGINNYGDIETGQLGNCANDKLELYFNKTRMTLARYPNIDQNGLWNFMQVAKVINNGTFQFSDARINQWKDTSTLWLHGYWQYDWADNYVKVLSIDHSSNEITIDPKTPTLYRIQPKARFYGVNILEEIDTPTEYYVNRTSGILYFYPPSQWKSGQSFVSVGETLIVMNNVSYVTIQDLQMLYSRTIAVEANGVSNVQIMNCEISLHGDSSISLYGTDCTVSGISVHDNGCGGIHVSGGDQKSLTRGNNLLTKSSISHYAQWKRTYQPAISWEGVGNKYTYNSVSYAPHTGILGGGNDCIFEYNHIANLCYEATDTGAFYTGRSWIDRGNIIRYSLFENIRMTEKTVLGSMSVQAIYLDDQMSGYEIYNNTFKNCYVGTFIGGGRRNIVYNNQYYNCTTAVHEDNRGLTWQKSECSPGGEFEEQLKSVNYQQPPWSQHYPFLVNIFNDHPCVPVYNNITNNTYCNTEHFTDLSTEDAKEWMDVLINNNEKC